MAQNAAEQSWKGSHDTWDERALRIPARRCNVSPRFEKPPELRFAKKALVFSNKLKHIYSWGAQEHLGGIVLQVTGTNFILFRKQV